MKSTLDKRTVVICRERERKNKVFGEHHGPQGLCVCAHQYGFLFNLKGHSSREKPVTQQRFRHIHSETQCSVTLTLCSCLSCTYRHMHTGNAQATHFSLRLSRTHVRTCTKNHPKIVECVWVRCNRWS